MAAAVALLFSACATNPPDAAASQTRIVTWNVLRGFLDRTQVEPAQQWLREQGPDVVALQEVNGFTAARLTEVAAAWGHAHAVMAKESGYPVALTSRSPIEVVERRLARFAIRALGFPLGLELVLLALRDDPPELVVLVG